MCIEFPSDTISIDGFLFKNIYAADFPWDVHLHELRAKV